MEINFKNFDKGQRINTKKRGHYAIYKVIERKTGKIYAAREIDCDDEESCDEMIKFEKKFITNVKHPAIIKYIGYSKQKIFDEFFITIIMKFAKNGSIADVIRGIQENNSLPEDYSDTCRQIILIGISNGMKYLHEKNYIHGNLKAENVLLDGQFNPLITDFFGHLYRDTKLGNSIRYSAPEILTNSTYDKKIDVYAFGILMYEILTNSFSYPELEYGDMSDLDFKYKVVKNKYRPKLDNKIKESLQEIITKCWSDDPNDRPSFEEIFDNLSNFNQHYFLDNVDTEKIKNYIYKINGVENASQQSLDKIHELHQINEQDLQKIDKFKDEISELNRINEQNLQKIDKFKDEISELNQTNENYLKKIDKFKNEISDLNYTKEQNLEKIDKLESELKRKVKQNQKEVENLIKVNKSLEQRNRKLDEENRIKKSNEAEKNRMRILISQINEIRNENTNLYNKNNELNNTNNNLINMNNYLENENNRLDRRNIDLENENKRIKNYSDTNIKKLTDQNKELMKEAKKLNSERQQSRNIDIAEYKRLIKENKKLEQEKKALEIFKIQFESQNLFYRSEIKISQLNENSKISEFNSLPLISQQTILQNIQSIHHYSYNYNYNFFNYINNLIYFLFRYVPKTINAGIEIAGTQNETISSINEIRRVQIDFLITEVLYNSKVLDSDDFYSIIKNFYEFCFCIKYPSERFQEIYNRLVEIRQKNPNKYKICIFITGINETDKYFYCDDKITYVEFDSNITKSIFDESFFGCKLITEITIPSSVKKIGDKSFSNCEELKKVIIQESLTEIGNCAFSKCSSLTQISIPLSVTSIGEYCFSECSKLIGIVLPNSITSISSGTFCQCRELSQIEIPASVKSIGDNAFYECSKLKNISGLLNVNYIGQNAFDGCSLLDELSLNPSLISFNSCMFSRCSALSKFDSLFVKLTAIETGVFWNCTSLTSFTITSTVTKIDDDAFNGCSNLKEILFEKPYSLKFIGKYAFYNCESLEQIEIPISVKKIGHSAFLGCNSLRKIKISSKLFIELSDLNNTTEIERIEVE